MKRSLHLFLQLSVCIAFFACSNSESGEVTTDDEVLIDDQSDDEIEIPSTEIFYYGADLSYVNEMEDCGANYKSSAGIETNVYEIFHNEGANLVRLRLWHNPTWTDYSNLADVKKSIQRAKELGMRVLLDFHYSDTWADPSKQQIPLAWISQINNTNQLGDLLYNYTYETLNDLKQSNLLPDIVQVGNEINGMILQDGELEWPINWTRNASLLNKGINAIRDFSEENNTDIEIMLHIAQPENALWWFNQATLAGVNDYDWIGISYYPIWSEYNLNNLSQPLTNLKTTYNKKLMIVETAYPFTLENNDAANNILGADALVSGIPASQQGQLNYLLQLETILKDAGGEGLVYWEPAWVSTTCNTQWAQGSHWDNATLFDFNNKPTLGIKFFNENNN